MDHFFYMGEALKEAQKAGDIGEVPIGAVIVMNNEIISKGYNLKEISGDATSHAEIVAIRKANEALGRWRLSGATLYVTLEPCPMCAGAILQARVDRVVFGAMDPKAGAAGSILNLLENSAFNHQVEVLAGIREEECSQILKDFFRRLRK